MNRRAILAVGLAGLAAALLGSWLILLVFDPIPMTAGDRPWVLTQLCFALGYSGFGAFLASRRPRNSIGWLFLATGLASASLLFAGEYAIRGILVAPGTFFGPAGDGFIRLAMVPTLPDCAAAIAAWPG